MYSIADPGCGSQSGVLPSQKGTEQAVLQSCSLTCARSPAGAHIVQRFCETSHEVSKLLKLASWREKNESSSKLQHFQHQGSTTKAEAFRGGFYILEYFACWESYWPNLLPCAQRVQSPLITVVVDWPKEVCSIPVRPSTTMLELGLTLLGHAAYCMSLVVLWHKPYSQGVPQASIKHAEIFPVLCGALFKVKPRSFR